MLELLDTEEITDDNIIDAVKRINAVIISDHKSIQTLQQELTSRDEKLLEAVHDLENKVDHGFHEMKGEQQKTNEHLDELENKVDHGFHEMKSEQQKTNEHLDELENKVDHGFHEMKGEQQKANEHLDEMVGVLKMIAKNTK